MGHEWPADAVLRGGKDEVFQPGKTGYGWLV